MSCFSVVHSNFFNFRVLLDKVHRHIIMKCDDTLKFFVLLINGELKRGYDFVLHREPQR